MTEKPKAMLTAAPVKYPPGARKVGIPGKKDQYPEKSPVANMSLRQERQEYANRAQRIARSGSTD